MNDGYRQVIHTLVATGQYNHKEGLIQMDEKLVISNHINVLSLNDWHKRLGHLS